MKRIYRTPQSEKMVLEIENALMTVSNIEVDPDTSIPDPSANHKKDELWGKNNMWE